MGILKARSRILLSSLLVIGVVAFWATASLASKPAIEKGMLPTEKDIAQEVACDADINSDKLVEILDTGEGEFLTHAMSDSTPMAVRIGKPYVSREGLKTVPLRILTSGGRHSGEGIGETRFWFDPTRPVESAIWERTSGTEFPAIQEMRFHFFFTLDSRPGKLYRSMTPATMRSDNVATFPPPTNTAYRLIRPVELEDVTEPGIAALRIKSNRVVLLKPRHDRNREEHVPM
jgi:hypothetical protein